MRISIPPGPRALKPMPSSTAPNSNFSKGLSLHLSAPSLQALTAYTLLKTAYRAGCYPEARITNFVDAQSRGIQPSVGRLIIGHKLCRQGIPLKESPGNRSALIQKPFSGRAGGDALHKVQRKARDVWSKIDGRVEVA